MIKLLSYIECCAFVVPYITVRILDTTYYNDTMMTSRIVGNLRYVTRARYIFALECQMSFGDLEGGRLKYDAT